MNRPPADETLVTVVICVYNVGEFLRPAIESVLAQTHRNLEVLIIDDGSTDGCMNTIGDLDDPRIRVLAQTNQGKPNALNRALTELHGDYFAIHDADDISHPRRIELQARALDENPDVAGVFTGFELIVGERRLAPSFAPRDVEQCRRDIQAFRMPAHDATVMFRVSMLGGAKYEPDLALGEGRDFILQVGERHPLLVLGECLYGYRIHPDSLTMREDSRVAYFDERVIQRACQRRGCPPPAANGMSPSRGKTDMILSQCMESVANLRDAGRRRDAWRTAWSCAGLRPFSARQYRPLVYALAPLSWIRAHRRKRQASH